MKTLARFAPLWSLLFALAASSPALGVEPARYEIRFPDLPGYQTLVCDFHTHTVFSDGNVWPGVRVMEAWREGIQVLAITDHIEYQPHKIDLPTKHNRPYELVAGAAQGRDLLLIRGAEITRDTPPGHFNALFLKDIAPLATKDFLEAIKRANEQGAFVFWNHQAWKGEEKGRWLDVHTKMFAKKWFQGMEVCNGDEYFPNAHKWCLEKNLTMLGNSDIHDPDLRLKSTAADHRTMTLVFAKERSLEAVKQALQERRTVVWYKDQLIGRREWLEPLFVACVTVEQPHHRTKDTIFVKVKNTSDTSIRLERSGKLGPPEILLSAGAITLLQLPAKLKEPIKLEYKATGFLIGPGKALAVTLNIPAMPQAVGAGVK